MHTTSLDTIWKVIKTSRPLFWIAHFLFFSFGTIATNKYIHPLSFNFLFPILLLTLPFSLFVYAINDYYDALSDTKNPRKGGIFGEKHTKLYHQKLPLLAAIGWIVSAGGFSIFGPHILLIFLIVSVMLYCYSAPPIRFKAIPILDFITGGYLYGLGISLLGFFIFHGDPQMFFHTISVPLYCSLVFATLYHIFFAIVDEVPDRQQGITTSAVFFGSRKLLSFCFCLIGVSFVVAVQNFILFLMLTACLIFCCLIWFPRYRKSILLQKIAGEYLMYIGLFVILYSLFIDQNFIK